MVRKPSRIAVTAENGQRSPMQVQAPSRIERIFDDLARQLVTEHHGPVACPEDARGQALGHPARRPAEYPFQKHELRPGDRYCLDDLPPLSVEAGDAGEHRVADACGHSRFPRRQHFGDVKRIAARQPVELDWIDRRAGPERSYALDRKRAQRDAPRLVDLGQDDPEPMVDADFVVAEGRD